MQNYHFLWTRNLPLLSWLGISGTPVVGGGWWLSSPVLASSSLPSSTSSGRCSSSSSECSSLSTRNLPVSLARSNGSTKSQDLTGQHPPDQTDRVTTLVVGWDSDIDELGWGISIAKSNDWDVDVGSLLDGLGIGTGVGDDDEAGFLEGPGDVVGEVTRGETTSDGDGTGVGGELQDSALSVRTSRNDTDIGGVVDGCDDAGCKDDLLPGLANVNDIDSIRASLPEVWLHVNLQ